MLVTGYPKSGTTWFCLMLANCLNVRYDNLMEPGVHPREEWQRKLTQGGLPHRAWTEETGGEVVFTHDPLRLEQRKPEEYSIYIVRDGRDVVVSFYYYLNRFLPEDQGGGRMRLRDRVRRLGESRRFSAFVKEKAAEWAQDVRRSLALKPDQVVRYEDLNRDAGATLSRIFRAWGIDMEPAVIAQSVEAFSFEHMAGRKKGDEDSRSFFRKGIIGDWHEKFSEADKRSFKQVAGDLLVELGYENDQSW